MRTDFEHMPTTTRTLRRARALAFALLAHIVTCTDCKDTKPRRATCKTCQGHGVLFEHKGTTHSAQTFLLLCGERETHQ